ncbi:hypothetical protein [Treponema sp. R80B11-R83G3]
MKKYLVIILFLTSFIFISCVSVETFIKEYNYSQIIPIERKTTLLIFDEKLILNEYSLRYRGDIKDVSPYPYLFFLGTKETTGRRYLFYKDNVPLYIVDILTMERHSQLNENFQFVFDPECNIYITDNTGTRRDFKINPKIQSVQLPYVIFHDNDIGEINFSYYRSQNKNNLEVKYESLTGCEISINYRQFGILAFYPPASLYIVDDNIINDKMAVYILATYASFLHHHKYRTAVLMD